jgi:hypothetical protein
MITLLIYLRLYIYAKEVMLECSLLLHDVWTTGYLFYLTRLTPAFGHCDEVSQIGMMKYLQQHDIY